MRGSTDGRSLGSCPRRDTARCSSACCTPNRTGLVELTPGTRPPDGKVQLNRRKHACHYLPAGAGAADAEWLGHLLEHAEQIVSGAYTAAGSTASRARRRSSGSRRGPDREGGKHAVNHTRWLWVDVDKPGELPALWALLAERPCHLLIESAGIRRHARLLEARARAAGGPGRRSTRASAVEWIERANLRLIHRLGTGPDGNPSVADRQCAERSRVMRLAGTVNWKTGRYARIVQADLALAPYPIAQLVGDLPEPAPPRPMRRRASDPREGPAISADPYKRIAPPDYFEVLAGVAVPRVRAACGAPLATRTDNPSCDVGGDACRAGGAAAAAPAARSTTSHRCCSAARPARRSAAKPSSAPART